MTARHGLDYALVAGLCLVLHNVVMIAADRLGLTLPLAILASFAIVVATGYVLHCRISFRRDIELAAFLRYALAMSANIPLALAVTWAWVGPAGLPMTAAAPLGTLCMVALNYVLSRWAIVRKGAAQ